MSTDEAKETKIDPYLANRARRILGKPPMVLVGRNQWVPYMVTAEDLEAAKDVASKTGQTWKLREAELLGLGRTMRPVKPKE